MQFYPTVSCKELRAGKGKYLLHHTALLVASSFANYDVATYGKVRHSIPSPILPTCVKERAADCGGFVATFKWGGKYPYTPEQYVAWLYSWKHPDNSPALPQWAAMMDYCCEDEITAGKPGIVEQRQRQTTENAYYFWQQFREVPWTWIPTIQGWEVADYERHALEMKPLIEEMQAHYGENSYFRVGIGTLCHRASTQMIREVVIAVLRILGDVPIHLWGIKRSTFEDDEALPANIVSVDSAAFNGMWGEKRNLWKIEKKENGHSYTQTEWVLQVALPRYIQGLQRVLSVPKQERLFD